MSSNLPYKQAANVERRTWDKETYEARAKARIDSEEKAASGEASRAEDAASDSFTGGKEEFQKAEAGAQGPMNSKRSYLKARRGKVDLESKVGKTEIINPDAVAAVDSNVSITDGVSKSVNGVGWHCKVCDCFLKDSLTYLDHINGKKHQRALGFSMRIAKSTTSEVISKLDELAKEQEAKAAEVTLGMSKESADVEVDEFEEIVKKKDEEIEQRKVERKRRRDERKRKSRQEVEHKIMEEGKVDENNNDTGEEGDGINPDMAALMGFSGFGGS
eukprot:scaffold10267_cov270-Chaetoceros_neogracile.AAC.29